MLINDYCLRNIMESFLRQFKQILLTAMLMLFIAPVIAQIQRAAAAPAKHPQSAEQKEFFRLVARAGVKFIYPDGFKEIKAPNNEDFSFDYGLELPGKEFEIWLQVKSEKEDWASYERAQNTSNTQLANPDSAYNELGKSQAKAFTGDQKYFFFT